MHSRAVFFYFPNCYSRKALQILPLNITPDDRSAVTNGIDRKVVELHTNGASNLSERLQRTICSNSTVLEWGILFKTASVISISIVFLICGYFGNCDSSHELDCEILSSWITNRLPSRDLWLSTPWRYGDDCPLYSVLSSVHNADVLQPAFIAECEKHVSLAKRFRSTCNHFRS